MPRTRQGLEGERKYLIKEINRAKKKIEKIEAELKLLQKPVKTAK